MKGRSPNKDEREFMDNMRQLGCIVCRNLGYGETPPAIHHMEGKTKQGAHFHVIPLCQRHHQEADTEKDKRWISRHGDGRAAFEVEYGKEIDLYHQCLELM